jgi:enamine deaminase RidA (YjgF/YER057c/UK114 family)
MSPLAQEPAMPTIEDRLARLGLTIPTPPKPVASYVPAVSIHAGNLVFIAGQIPLVAGKPMAVGTVPDQVSRDLARECARQCALNGLACLQQEIGSLEKLRRVVRLDAFVACHPGFGDHPQIVNGASDLLVEILGEAGKHARVSVGAPSLPLNVPVEIAFTFLVD